MEIVVPIKGYSEAASTDKAPPLTSSDMLNVRPTDTLERQLRLGQRPGLDKRYDEQIGGVAMPIVALLSVTTVA